MPQTTAADNPRSTTPLAAKKDAKLSPCPVPVILALLKLIIEVITVGIVCTMICKAITSKIMVVIILPGSEKFEAKPLPIFYHLDCI